MDKIELGIFVGRLSAVCEEMGVVLQRAAFSPNIKDRLDFSCAIFDRFGELCAQAAHIPVHLGSMAYAMADLVGTQQWREGQMLILNDPYKGGTHLPDVTLVAPVFHQGELLAFVVNRAHHANIGAEAPGSMPISSCLAEEGVLIEPVMLLEKNEVQWEVLADVCTLDEQSLQNLRENPTLANSDVGDFMAQISANKVGQLRLLELLKSSDPERFTQSLVALNDYTERLARSYYQSIPDGTYTFQDQMDSDGQGASAVNINASIQVSGSSIHVNFEGTHPQVAGNINCPLSVAAAAVFYVFRCLLPAEAPASAGGFRPITLQAPAGSLVNAQAPAAVAAGNVETSSRIVDVVLGALAKALPDIIPAASQGSMNNVAMGASSSMEGCAGSAHSWDYYETIAGGMGAGPNGSGLSGVHTHMTNTLNTPIESLEMHYPLRVLRYALREGSGGAGHYTGGEGLIRELKFLGPAKACLLTERRQSQPYGLAGGGAGRSGENRVNGVPVLDKIALDLKQDDVLTIFTPGGGGWGNAET